MVRVAIPLIHWQDRNPEKLRANIVKELERIFGFLPPYKLVKLGISASDWKIWVQLDVKTECLDNPKGE